MANLKNICCPLDRFFFFNKLAQAKSILKPHSPGVPSKGSEAASL